MREQQLPRHHVVADCMLIAANAQMIGAACTRSHHAENPLAGVAQLKVFVSKAVAIDGAAASAIVGSEVATFRHERKQQVNIMCWCSSGRCRSRATGGMFGQQRHLLGSSRTYTCAQAMIHVHRPCFMRTDLDSCAQTLIHEPRNYAVEAGALVALARRLLGQLQEVLGGLRHDILLQLQRHKSCVTYSGQRCDPSPTCVSVVDTSNLLVPTARISIASSSRVACSRRLSSGPP